MQICKSMKIVRGNGPNLLQEAFTAALSLFFLSLSFFYFEEVNVEWKRLAAGLVPSIKHDQDSVDEDTLPHGIDQLHHFEAHQKQEFLSAS